jgi:hypothetical protein
MPPPRKRDSLGKTVQKTAAIPPPAPASDFIRPDTEIARFGALAILLIVLFRRTRTAASNDHSAAYGEQHAQHVPVLYDGVRELGAKISWGTGNTSGSFNPQWPHLSAKSLLTLSTNGKLQLNFGWLNDTEAAIRRRDRLIAALRGAGWSVPDQPEGRYLSVPLAEWTSRGSQLLDILRSVVNTGPDG